MPAITFFVMLAEGYRTRSARLLMQAQITLLPYVDKDVRRRFMDSLREGAKDPTDVILKPSTRNGEEQLKRLLGGF